MNKSPAMVLQSDGSIAWLAMRLRREDYDSLQHYSKHTPFSVLLGGCMEIRWLEDFIALA